MLLCRSCWARLPEATRAAISSRAWTVDRKACIAAMWAMLKQVKAGTPLEEIKV
jgi:hypothetical protein